MYLKTLSIWTFYSELYWVLLVNAAMETMAAGCASMAKASKYILRCINSKLEIRNVVSSVEICLTES